MRSFVCAKDIQQLSTFDPERVCKVLVTCLNQDLQDLQITRITLSRLFDAD